MTPALPGLFAIILYLLASGLLLLKLLRGILDAGCQRSQSLMLALAAVSIHGLILYPGHLFLDDGDTINFICSASPM